MLLEAKFVTVKQTAKFAVHMGTPEASKCWKKSVKNSKNERKKLKRKHTVIRGGKRGKTMACDLQQSYFPNVGVLCVSDSATVHAIFVSGLAVLNFVCVFVCGVVVLIWL